jgi:hypothetical protein
MNNRVNCSCQIKTSKLGAKGFYYIDESSQFLSIKKDTPVEILSFVSGRDFADWQAVAIENCLVEGSAFEDGKSVYWIMRKNLS